MKNKKYEEILKDWEEAVKAKAEARKAYDEARKAENEAYEAVMTTPEYKAWEGTWKEVNEP